MSRLTRKHTLHPDSNEYRIATHLQEVGPLSVLEAGEDYHLSVPEMEDIAENLRRSGYDVTYEHDCWRMRR